MSDPLGLHPTPILQKGKLRPRGCSRLPPLGKSQCPSSIPINMSEPLQSAWSVRLQG